MGLPPIVLTCDGSYAMPLAATLRSLIDANRPHWPIGLYVLSEKFTADAKARVAGSLPGQSARICWVPVDAQRFDRFDRWQQTTRMNYARLLIPEIFGAETQRVLYLDADVLVLDDVGPLAATELGGAVLGAALDDGIEPLLQQERLGERRVPRVEHYFNAGVLVIDVARWTAEAITERAMGYLAENPRTSYADQDSLNYACDRRWRRLDPKWNHQRHLVEAVQDLPADRRPAIVHFVTGDKPWHAWTLNPNARLFDAVRQRTAFARSWLEIVHDFAVAGWTMGKHAIRRQVAHRPALSEPLLPRQHS